MNIRQTIEEFKKDTDYYQYIECSKEEADKLKEDGIEILAKDRYVKGKDVVVYFKVIPKYSDEEYFKTLKILKSKNISTIKNCVVFIAIVVGVWVLISLLIAFDLLK